MAIFRYLLLAFLISVSGCSKEQPPAAAKPVQASPPVQPPFPAGDLVDSQIHFEFAVYYLPVPSTDPLIDLDKLLASDFSGVRRVEKLPNESPDLCVAARMNTAVPSSYAPPPPDSLARFGRGLSKEQAEALQASLHALVLDFAYPKEHAWDHLRRACQLASSLARQTGGLLWDEETREVFTPDAWDERRLKGWESGVPDVSKHTVIHAYSTGEDVRAITLGMGKFGLPDVVVDNFSWSTSKQIGNLINLFAQATAEGAQVMKTGEYDLDLKSLGNEEARDPQLKSLQNHATAKAQLSLRQGTKEEGDPNNRLIELGFDRYPGGDIHARQEAMVSTLFGWQDAIKNIKHDGELEAASQRARAQLPALQTAFLKGLPPGEYIELKAPFDVPAGGHEYMWIEVTTWDGEKIKGLLKNEPFRIPSLHGGQIVEIEQKSVFDFIRRFADGTQTGNETGPIIEKMSGAEEKR